jgi:hypothetical protein
MEKCFAIELMSGINNWTKSHQDFKMGEFKICNYEIACKIGDMLLDIPKEIKFRKRKILTRTLGELMLANGYDHIRMMKKMKSYHDILVKCVNMESTLQNLESVYNFQCGFKSKVHFMIDYEPKTKRKIVRIIPYNEK